MREDSDSIPNQTFCSLIQEEGGDTLVLVGHNEIHLTR